MHAMLRDGTEFASAYVAVKSEDQQATLMAYKTRELLIKQRTMSVNALRGHLAEWPGLPKPHSNATAVTEVSASGRDNFCRARRRRTRLTKSIGVYPRPALNAEKRLRALTLVATTNVSIVIG